MKRLKEILRYLCLTILAFIAVSCEKEEGGDITFTTTSSVELYSVTNQSQDMTFETSGTWKATCSATWLTFSPKSGEAGKHTITISTTSTNRTKSTRMAKLTIECDGQSKSMTIKQRDEYAYFEQEEVNLGPESTTLTLRFRTNVNEGDLSIYSTPGLTEWITANSGARTRTEYQGTLNALRVKENTSENARDGAFFLVIKDKSGNVLPLDTLFIFQEGADNGYQSADYSADGKVDVMNRSTEGKGIPVVLMGDGFVDRDVADGTYAKVMQQAMDNLFSEEPVKSLKSYFDVYQVTAVSPRNRFEGSGVTALGTIPDHQTMGITVDANAVQWYVKKVENIDSLHTLAVVIMNTNISKGVTYMMRSSKYSDYSYAIALCPVIDSLKSETFRQVLTHEAIGHGFAKLADEYVRSTEGSATEEDIEELKRLHEKWGWFMNVDAESDSAKVIWSKFLFENAFADEKLGVYEGAYTFYKGVYRPSQESMMRSNDAPFNAPSRQAIYNQVMKLGKNRTPGFDEFVAFDKLHKPSTWSYQSRTRQGGRMLWRPAPPRIIYADW